jgi:uncharacterized membrane protein
MQEKGVNQMLKVETSLVIHRSVEDVFAVLNELENYPKWSATFQEITKTSTGPTGVGTTWTGVGKSLGRRIETKIEQTEYEPNRKYTRKSNSPFPVHEQMTFESIEGGTRVNVRFEAEPGGFFKLAEPLVAKIGKRNIEADLAALKDLMEAHAL